MGADMLIASLGFRKEKTAGRTRRNIEALLRAAERKIRAANAVSDLGEYRDFCLPDRAEDNTTMTDIKQALLRDLKDIRCALLGSHRQACLIDGGGGIDILVSGGLSWGDDPCELFIAINHLQTAGVIEDARYARALMTHAH